MNRNPCRRRVAYLSDYWPAIDPSESLTLHGSLCTSGATVDTESCALFAQLPRGVRKRIEGYGLWAGALGFMRKPSIVRLGCDLLALALASSRVLVRTFGPSSIQSP